MPPKRTVGLPIPHVRPHPMSCSMAYYVSVYVVRTVCTYVCTSYTYTYLHNGCPTIPNMPVHFQRRIGPSTHSQSICSPDGLRSWWVTERSLEPLCVPRRPRILTSPPGHLCWWSLGRTFHSRACSSGPKPRRKDWTIFCLLRPRPPATPVCFHFVGNLWRVTPSQRLLRSAFPVLNLLA